MEKLCAARGWDILGESRHFVFNDKMLFRKILEKIGIDTIPGETAKLQNIDYREMKKSYGRFVVQMRSGGGGRGTFFIKSEEELEGVKERFGEEDVIVTKFVEGPSPSITGCVAGRNVVWTCPQYQLTDVREVTNPSAGSGVFCGHDWTMSARIPERIKKSAYDCTEKIGRFLMEREYKGIFGLDFVIDKKQGKLFPVEINPRLLGSFPTLDMIQDVNGEFPIMALHIAELVGIDFEVNAERLKKGMMLPKRGSQLMLYNRSVSDSVNRKSLKPGVYRFAGSGPEFIRDGYRISDIRANEFLLTDGVPDQGTIFAPHEKVMRLLTLDSVSSGRKLNEAFSTTAKEIYRKLDLQKV